MHLGQSSNASLLALFLAVYVVSYNLKVAFSRGIGYVSQEEVSVTDDMKVRLVFVCWPGPMLLLYHHGDRGEGSWKIDIQMLSDDNSSFSIALTHT
jgi:hypothetical protein